MTKTTSHNELQSLLEAITSSDVVESRIELLTKLRELDSFEKSELAHLMASLTMFWEDFTCLDVSQCILNKTILSVAAKCLESEIFGCLSHFLSLGIKASIWCIKHLKMTLMSTGDSQEEEHFNLFFQLLLDVLHYSASCFSALARYPLSDDKELKVMIENHFFEQLNLTKESISEIKRIRTFSSEVLKVTQVVIDAVIRLCRVYINDVNMDSLDTEKDKASLNSEEVDNINHVIIITKCAIEQFRDLGVIAANNGGNLVTLLNSSWKGVVALLQLGKGALATKLNIADIILSLMSLVNGSLRCAAENWSFVTEKVTTAEAKRIFLPIKFYLINAVRISSQYPCQSFSVYKDLILCVLIISSFKFFLIEEKLLKVAGEILVELLEPVSFHLLNSILNSAQLNEEDKILILNWLFDDDNHICARDQTHHPKNSEMHTIFSLDNDNMQGSKVLLLGRVALFLNLLKSAPDLEEDVRLGMARKLGWLLEVLVDEDIYSVSLGVELPIACGSGKNQELVYQPIFVSVLHALKTFMITASSGVAWMEINSFLLENIFHPHFLCQEIVMELWCFLVRHAEEDIANDIIDKLCSILTFVASSDSILAPVSASRKVAKSICMFLSHVSQSTLDRIYATVVDSNGSQLPPVALIALLMEGFPLDLLSVKMKSIATKRIISDFLDFMESFKDAPCRAHDSGVFGDSVFVLSAVLPSLQGIKSDIDKKILRFLVEVIHSYKSAVENSVKDHLCKVLSETLGIISNKKHLYASDEMEEVVLELQNVFISSPVAEVDLYQCKPNLAKFMAGFGHIELDMSDSNAKGLTVLELFHMLLKERHWAFAHLAISAFAYFAERTNCNQLWRFVPENAALSYDLDSAKEANMERFLGEVKVFLNKERALLTEAPSYDQLRLLVKEGRMLKELVQKHQNVEFGSMKNNAMDIDVEKQSHKQTKYYDEIKYEIMEIDVDKQSSKRRKLPEEIRHGVGLLQSGLKSIGDGISELQRNNFDSTDIRDKLLSHYSNLQDVIGQLVGPDYE